MRHLTIQEMGQNRHEYLNLGQLFTHLPYCRLVPHAKDSYGVLRAWPKWRAVARLLPLTTCPVVVSESHQFREALLFQNDFVNPETTWQQLFAQDPPIASLWSAVAWRPLVSYTKARWKKLLNLAGKFCIHALRTLNIGLPINNPRGFVERIHAFNNRERPIPSCEFLEANVTSNLRMRVFDVKNFFPSIPHAEFDDALEVVILLLLARNADWQWF